MKKSQMLTIKTKLINNIKIQSIIVNTFILKLTPILQSL